MISVTTIKVVAMFTSSVSPAIINNNSIFHWTAQVYIHTLSRSRFKGELAGVLGADPGEREVGSYEQHTDKTINQSSDINNHFTRFPVINM